MDRMACIDIRGLPLQLLLRDHCGWATGPVVVVDRDKPQGLILWANDRAYAHRIFPGMRYAAALAVSREVRGGVVPHTAITSAIDEVTQRLWSFSPRVEPSPVEHGVFWLDASGLRHVFASLEDWADLIRDDLRSVGFSAVVAVGFTRFGSFAGARANTRNILFAGAEQERAYLRGIAIDRLGFDPVLRDTLLKLGVETLGKFVDLPGATIHRRFGPAAAALHELARGEGWSPLLPEPIVEPVEWREALDYPEESVDRLLARCAGMLQSLVAQLSARHELLKTLHILLKLGDGSTREEDVAPATPTCDTQQMLLLLRLRFATLTLSAPVMELRARADGVGVSTRQLGLFKDTPQHSVDAAQEAFAKLRAQFGNDAVVYAKLGEGHLPEACYSWERLERLKTPKPIAVAVRPLVRRIYTPPIELPPSDRREPDGWLIAGIAEGPIEEVIGPQIVCGGWWRKELSRAYHFARTRSGRWLWIYHDHKRRRWFLCGEVQ